MSWPEQMDPELRDYIEERQGTALRTYENDPDLLVEHVRQEDSFRTGGYGTRQISELLQNAVDAIGTGGGTGMVEFRLADGALYCANEGAPFARDGLRAVTYAFLSTKRGDEIGRFGLGFKSILGITDHPQIFSRSVSFEFNAPDTAALFAGIPNEGGRLPLLRIPTLADAGAAAKADPNLAELMAWATIIVKLPLTREGERLYKELLEFDVEALLFFKPLERLRITVQKSPGGAPVSLDYARAGHPDDGEVHLIAPGQERERWLYAEREYRPSIDVASTLPATALRETMTVSYAVRPEGRAGVGRLWAWFPLKDETTASGVFNAPWQVNDDRTSLVPGSALNRAMLGVAADLFLDVVARASSSKDFGAHLDLFPARGREARSNADKFLSNSIPYRAMQRPMVPDTTGELKVPGYFERVPDLQKTPIPPAAMRAWQERPPRETMPHWQCFSTPTRRLRLRTLLGGTDDERSSREANVAAWLEELVSARDRDGVESAISIAAALAPLSPEMSAAVGSAPIVPLEDGGWARVDASASVLLPLEGTEVPEGVGVVASDLARFGTIADDLRTLGFRVVSADETAGALAHGAHSEWADEQWKHFWTVLSAARPDVAERAVRTVRERGVELRLPAQNGSWRPAREIIADAGFGRRLPGRHVDSQIVPSLALVRAAGATEAPHMGYPLGLDGLRRSYTSAVEKMAAEYLRRSGLHGVRVVVPDGDGVGPLDILDEDLTDEERISWTRSVLRAMGPRETVLKVPVSAGRVAEIPTSTFEWWAIRNLGAVNTSLGVRRVTDAVSSRLNRFSAYLPVVLDAEVSVNIGLATELERVADTHLVSFLGREGYDVRAAGEDAFVELLVHCARRESLGVPERIPAISKGSVVLSPPDEVAVTETPQDAGALDEAGVSYIPAGSAAGQLVEGWHLLAASDALQQSLEVLGAGEATPVLDLFPSLQSRATVKLAKLRITTAESISRVLQSVHGVTKRPLMAAKKDGLVVMDSSLDDVGTLEWLSRVLDLGLTTSDIAGVLRDDEALRRSELLQRAQLAHTDEERLLLLVGPGVLRAELPRGLITAVENSAGAQTDLDIATLFLRVHGNDALYLLRDRFKAQHIEVPRAWDGSPQAQAAVKRMGFDTKYAGERAMRPPRVTQVQGKITLNGLHDFQEDLAEQIRDLVLRQGSDGQARRGLLHLPTGAGKTRVTAEAVLKMMRDGELASPVLWVAQSQELCEQAIQTFGEVWRWLGDERPVDLSRFWSGYELDESNEELQVVFAIDDTLDSRLGENTYAWLAEASLVIVDEAHTAGDSPTYTRILRNLGIDQRVAGGRTARPLLGLTATPFKGRNPDVNEQFARRFGNNPLTALDPDDPIAELRDRRVLSQVDHEVLNGLAYSMDEQGQRMREVSKAMLDRIGSDISRTQLVVSDIAGRPSDWQILVFTPSVASAHTTAALLQLEDIEADAVDGSMRKSERRRVVERFKSGESRVLVNCDLLTQGFDAPQVRALYIARPTFSPNRYIQMVGRGLRGPANGGTERCLIVNVADTFEQFGEELAYNEFDYLWSKK